MSIYSELSAVLSKDVVEAWLVSKGSTTWGGHGWDVVDDKELPEAAEWLIKQIEDLIAFAAVNSKGLL
jgi:hypothetical protein